jgi:plasmid stabilization system protein ParE
VLTAHSLDVLAEYLDAVDTYEQQRPGRGERFKRQLEATFRLIRENPLRFRVITGPHGRYAIRRAVVAKFPYVVLYYVQRGKAVVVAIAHGHREPGYWRRRLQRG